MAQSKSSEVQACPQLQNFTFVLIELVRDAVESGGVLFSPHCSGHQLISLAFPTVTCGTDGAITVDLYMKKKGRDCKINRKEKRRVAVIRP